MDSTSKFIKAAGKTSLSSVSANQLLNREPDSKYLEEWTELLRKEKESEKVLPESSIVIFRLGEDWLGMNTHVFVEVFEYQFIHSIPHISNSILLGTVNFRGQLWLCFSLEHLLEFESTEKVKEVSKRTVKYQRMVAVQKEKDRWVFPVEDIYGVHHFDLNHQENVPSTLEKSASTYLKGMVRWENRDVALFDEELLFSTLHRSVF